MGQIQVKAYNLTKKMTGDLDVEYSVFNRLTDDENSFTLTEKKTLANIPAGHERAMLANKLLPTNWNLDDEIYVTGPCGGYYRYDNK